MDQDSKDKQPKQAMILGRRYRIEFVEKVDDDNNFGEHDCATQHIKVKASITDDLKKATVLHECLHAIDDALGLELTEDDVQKLEGGLFAWMRDNKKIVRWILHTG